MPGGLHGSEALDIPARMLGVGFDLAHPGTLLDHDSIVRDDSMGRDAGRA